MTHLQTGFKDPTKAILSDSARVGSIHSHVAASAAAMAGSLFIETTLLLGTIRSRPHLFKTTIPISAQLAHAAVAVV